MSNNLRWVLAITLIFVLAGCRSDSGNEAAEPAEGAAPVEESAPEALTIDQLMNMTYTLPSGQEVTLSGGKYEEKPSPDSATMIINVELVEDLTAFGDLNGDGVDDASVILVDAPGGSGVFNYLAAVVNEEGAPVNTDTADLGDRTFVESNTIDSEITTLEVVAHAEDDPMCCPTEKRVWTYALEDGALAQTGNELVGTVEPEGNTGAASTDSALVGVTWQWLQTVMNDDTQRLPDDPTMHTVTFNADGTVSVQADCNVGTGAYTTEENKITIDVQTMTMAMCPEGSLGEAFVADLNAVAGYFSEGEDLMFDLKFDSGNMLLTAGAAADAE